MINKYFWYFSIIPLLDFFILISVSDSIGVGITVLIVIITALIGSTLVKKTGKEVFRNLQNAMMMQGSLSDAIIDGAILIASGVLLVTPGFFTDIFALIIHIPIIKNLVKKFIIHKFKDNMVVMSNSNRTYYNNDDFYENGRVYDMDDFKDS